LLSVTGVAPVFDQQTVFEHYRTIHTPGEVGIMGYYDQAGTEFPIEIQHEIEDPFPGRMIQVAGWFVSKHNRRTGDQGPGDRRSLAFATRQLSGSMGHSLA
jgi:hypothetical protein